jgi:hypothetical protein
MYADTCINPLAGHDVKLDASQGALDLILIETFYNVAFLNVAFLR